MSGTVRKITNSPELAPITAPLSPGVLVDKTLYISGQLGMTKEGELLTGITQQTQQALENMGHVLTAAGATFRNVVKVSVLLSNLDDTPQMNAIYSTFFTENHPARAAYQVGRLPLDALIEIEAIAIVGDVVDG